MVRTRGTATAGTLARASVEAVDAKQVGERLVAAIGVRDFEEIERLLAPNVRFRALVPERVREHDNAAETLERLRLWWGDADVFELVDSHVEEVADRVGLSYQIRCRENGEWYLVEQRGYAEVKSDHVVDLSLVCLGFRPANGP
jgi:hypothetical protein